MQRFDWKTKYKDKIMHRRRGDASSIKSGDSIFIGTGCGQPQHLVNALVEHSDARLRRAHHPPADDGRGALRRRAASARSSR